MVAVCNHVEQVTCPNCDPRRTMPYYTPPYPAMVTVEESVTARDAELMKLRLKLQAVEHDLEHVVQERDQATERAEDLQSEVYMLATQLAYAREDRDDARREVKILTDDIQHLEALLEDAVRDRDEARLDAEQTHKNLTMMTACRDVLHNSVIRLVRGMSRQGET